MKKLSLVLSLALLVPQLADAQAQLKGFSYQAPQAPTGQEWQSPEAYAEGKLQPRATFYSFASSGEALGVLPEKSTYHRSLDGSWRFRWVGNPEERTKDFYLPSFDDKGWDLVSVPMSWNIYGLQKDGTQRYGTPIYLNQRVPFHHEVKVDDWKGGVMRTPPKDHTMYKHRNEVGAYRRSFTIDEVWQGREVYINFDGVDSFFYLWINGKYVGFSKNSRNRASFDISPYLVKGENIVAVEVYRNSDGSFLESQDMFRLPGIFRSVSLTAKPKTQIQDLQIIPSLDDKYEHASLAVRADLKNLTSKASKGLKLRYTLYELPLYEDAGAKQVGQSQMSSLVDLVGQGTARVQTTMELTKPKLWSAEEPHRYIFVAELLDKKNQVLETVSTYTGIREVEVKEVAAKDDEFGLAGRYFLINGKPVKLKGVNRHETHPETGHALTRQMMLDEVMMMKRANINHVRNSHYPPDPYFYYLCDKYGIYLEDEANIESHQYYYGKASLSHVKEFDIQTTNRMLEMVYANINHPSIVIWSLGNEAGPGDNFKRSYAATKAVDSSRPVQYERNNDIVDIGSNQYPSIPWVREAVKGKYKIKYPFHISEYAHSMGNAVGGLQDYWTAMESSNFFCGGAIWDWVDQAMYNYLPDGRRYAAYGGDFGDTPNDGMFVMNGIIFADRTPKPQYYEVQKVYQYVGITDEKLASEGTVRLFNKNYYTDLSPQDYHLVATLSREGKTIERKELELPTIAPRQSALLKLSFDEVQKGLDPKAEYFVQLALELRRDMPWAKAGYTQASEQLLLQTPRELPKLSDLASQGKAKLKLEPAKGATAQGIVAVEGEGFVVRFDQSKGTIHSLEYDGKPVIVEGQGPKIDAFRAACDNDNWAYEAWGANGLHNLQHKTLSSYSYTRPDGAVLMFYLVESQAPNAAKIGRKKRWASESSGRYTIEEDTKHPFGSEDFKFTTAQSWIVYPDGSIELQANIVSNKPNLALARLGYEVIVPKEYNQYSYYGRGPINNYSDRKTSQFVAEYNSTVADQFVNFPKPQTMGNREDVRWVALRNDKGVGVLFQAGSRMSASALPWSAKELLLAPHPHELPPAGDTHLHLDASVNGLGGNSCGQGGPLEDCRSYGRQQLFSFVLRPLRAGSSIERVALTSEVAPIINRDSRGEVSITAGEGEEILYSLGKGKPQVYKGAFALREGGTLTAWTKRNPRIKVNQSFAKASFVPLEVIYASSQESGDGDAKNLTDGSNETIWHTMYSVTVAQFPHWIDFDANREQIIKGFSYTPRLDGSDNGDIRDYSLSISQDGKTWTEVHKGTFPRRKQKQVVTLAKPVKARYVRFTGLNAHNGADYASGSEFSLIVD